MANYNAGPISATYGSNGQPVPKASNINLAGHTWCVAGLCTGVLRVIDVEDRNLFVGSNGANNVFSFLPTSGTITSFSGDINTFFQVIVAQLGGKRTTMLMIGTLACSI